MLYTKAKTLKSRRGETYIDTGIKILICVVCGALLLGSVFWILKDTVLKNVKDSIVEMFEPPDKNPIDGDSGSDEIIPVKGSSDDWEVVGDTIVGYIGEMSPGMSLTVPNMVEDVWVTKITGDEEEYYNVLGNDDDKNLT